MFGTLDLGEIVNRQASYWLGVIPAWNVFAQPLAFVLFLICIHAEANRAPFDTAEAEQELVGGYHTEYSSMRFALFFLAEYAGMITTQRRLRRPVLRRLAPAVARLRSGRPLRRDRRRQPRRVTDSIIAGIVRAGVFFGKTMAIIFVFMWVRWSLPRFRFDQIMMPRVAGLIPISLALLMVTRSSSTSGVPTTPTTCESAARWRSRSWSSNIGLAIVTMVVSLILPPAPATNRKIAIPNSRFTRAGLPGRRGVTAPALNRAAVESVAVGDAVVSGRVGA